MDETLRKLSYQYRLAILKDKSANGILKTNGWKGWIVEGDGYIEWFKDKCWHPNFYATPFNSPDQHSAIRIEGNTEGGGYSMWLPFKLTWEPEEDFKQYMKIIKEVINGPCLAKTGKCT